MPMTHEQELVYLQSKLIEAALQYARVSTMRRFLDDKGTWVILCGSDDKTYAEHYTREMQECARRLLAELSTAKLPEVPPPA